MSSNEVITNEELSRFKDFKEHIIKYIIEPLNFLFIGIRIILFNPGMFMCQILVNIVFMLISSWDFNINGNLKIPLGIPLLVNLTKLGVTFLTIVIFKGDIAIVIRVLFGIRMNSDMNNVAYSWIKNCSAVIITLEVCFVIIGITTLVLNINLRETYNEQITWIFLLSLTIWSILCILDTIIITRLQVRQRIFRTDRRDITDITDRIDRIDRSNLENDIKRWMIISVYLNGNDNGSNDNDNDNDNDNTCVICLDNFVEGDEVAIMIECCHKFHLSCIKEWVGIQAVCPLCKNTLI